MFALFFLLPAALGAQALASSTAHIQLSSNLQMNLSADQVGAACWPGYVWNTQYGGCRRTQIEQGKESQACPAGSLGQQTRSNFRYQYVAQANGQISNGPWNYGPWDTSACQPPWAPTADVHSDIAQSLPVTYGHGTAFGGGSTYYVYLMLHKASGTLWCYAALSAYEAGPHPMVSAYPAEGRVYSDTYKQSQMNQCQVSGNTVSFGGSDTGYGTITRTTINSCTHRFSRSTGYVPYPAPLNDTLYTC
ncbi:hypothetical protein H0484_04040 [Pusillimonas sp. CC-YST705]|uniref:Secreted protein n=1 Tax=Mesopusillimonas faecipullorum TaxID=2755040 RepID=A0ABS8CA58_9BURK|nr:hypothetical protein [Mesopusillimonas faecipullorum]MCB5362926.1 hypothetical protein [Mesopusillimonas faecipullorum]